MLEQPAPLLLMANLVRPAPGHHFVFGYDEEAMDQAVLLDRCPGAKFIGPAKCTGRKILFTRDGATMVPRLGAEVHGVVWDVDSAGLAKLESSPSPSGIRRWCSAFARQTTDRLMETNIYTLVAPRTGSPDPTLILRVAELTRRLGFPIAYTNEIRGWLGVPVH